MGSDALRADDPPPWRGKAVMHDADAAMSDRSSGSRSNRWWTESLEAAERSKQAMANTHDALAFALTQLQKLGSKVKNDISQSTQQAASDREELLEILLRLSNEHREVQRRHRFEQELWEQGFAENVRFDFLPGGYGGWG
jgi:dsDNA-specific endonuclease/ATPase MutS2